MLSKSLATVNPCSMCMPMGSVLVFRGIENCMTLFHGSQGCSTYMRLYLAHHFREPVDIASSALSEKGAVYGGAANLKQGLRNVIKGYNPKAIGIATTCLAETIGDDVPQIVREFQAEEPLAKDVTFISVSTPSYAASHEVGYRVALKNLVQTLAKRSMPGKQSSGKINILVGSIVSPADVRYLKRLLDDWGHRYILLPDISETFDAPLSEDLPRIPLGGTPLDDIRDSANSLATVTVGGLLQEPGAGDFLRREFDLPHKPLPLPIGLEYCDRLVACLEELTGEAMPESYERERGRLLDTMVDAHKIVADARTAVFGDTETVLGLVRLMTELGMRPQIIATGAINPAFAEAAAGLAPGSRIMTGADYSEIAEEVSTRDIELMVGPFTGRQTARKEKVPLLRVGLPNHDRFGASHQLMLGYEGTMHLVDRLANALIESKESRPA